MTTLYEAAYAKVNLTLNVLGKREDGYHDLQSVMQTISLRAHLQNIFQLRLGQSRFPFGNGLTGNAELFAELFLRPTVFLS